MKSPASLSPFLSRRAARLPQCLLATVFTVAAVQAAWADSICTRLPSETQVLALVNAVRAQAQQCGGHAVGAAPSLRWNDTLSRSAQVYAAELAARGQLSHEGRTHRRLRDRVESQGYRMRMIGENLAMGVEVVPALMTLWLSSPEHCANLMEPLFTELGLACAMSQAHDGQPPSAYWVMHVGRSQDWTPGRP